MKRVLLSSVAVLGLMGAANAADLRMPVKAPPLVAPAIFSWTGCYIGAHIGGGWGNKRWRDLGDDNSDDTRYDVSGVVGGGQIGCDYQTGFWVFGVEADLAATGIRGSGDLPFEPEPSTFESRIDWIATVTGRIGYTPASQWLLYFKGGAAFARERHILTEVYESEVQSVTLRATHSGWTVGGGVEYAFTPNWSFKVEYNYLNFGHKDFLFTPLADDEARVHQELHIVKVGLNWRWGVSPVVARY